MLELSLVRFLVSRQTRRLRQTDKSTTNSAFSPFEGRNECNVGVEVHAATFLANGQLARATAQEAGK